MNRGVVLITVLWIVLILSFISLSLASAIRVEVSATRDSFNSDQALYMAKSAAEVVLAGLKDPTILKGLPLTEDHGNYTVPFTAGFAHVSVLSRGGLIDINAAPPKLLMAMFNSVGVSASLSTELADSIVDWRDPDDIPELNGAEITDYGDILPGARRLPRNGPFQTSDELLLVKHMTPEVYYGHIEFDPRTQTHKKVLGVRELITVGSGQKEVNMSEATPAVIAALPGMSPGLVEAIIFERTREPFKSDHDMLDRLPELAGSEAAEFVTSKTGNPTHIVSTATIQSSGASRTVRLNLQWGRKKQILLAAPLIYKDLEVIESGRWEY